MNYGIITIRVVTIATGIPGCNVLANVVTSYLLDTTAADTDNLILHLLNVGRRT